MDKRRDDLPQHCAYQKGTKLQPETQKEQKDAYLVSETKNQSGVAESELKDNDQSLWSNITLQ